MGRKRRSKSDHLDDILDENILNGDMSEDELDEVLSGRKSDDEQDDLLDEDESDDDSTDDISGDEMSDSESDDVSSDEIFDSEDDEESDVEISEEDLDDILDDKMSEAELDEILNDVLSDDEYDDISKDDSEDDEPDDDISYKRKNTEFEEKSNAGILLGIAWILFAVLCAVYVYVFFIKKPPEIPGKNNTVKLDIPDGANYRLCDIKEIDQLVTNFLTARANCDQQVLQSLVTDPSQFDDISVLQMIFTDYARGYANTTCYIVDGYDENGYIVIELSNLKLVDIKSQPLDVMSFYIIKAEDGTYRIDNSVHSTEVETYISNVTATKDIQDIYIHVKDQNDYLLKTDTAFADLYHRIME